MDELPAWLREDAGMKIIYKHSLKAKELVRFAVNFIMVTAEYIDTYPTLIDPPYGFETKQDLHEAARKADRRLTQGGGVWKMMYDAKQIDDIFLSFQDALVSDDTYLAMSGLKKLYEDMPRVTKDVPTSEQGDQNEF